MASLRVDEAAFSSEREVVKEERRQRVENQPYGRLAEIVYDARLHHAPVQAPGDRQHGRPRGGEHRGRARVLRHLLRARERHAGDRRRLRPRRTRWRWSSSTSAGCRRRRSRCRATSRSSRRRPRAARHGRRGRAAAGRRRRAPHHLRRAPRLAIRCTSSPRCCPTATARASTSGWSTRSASRSRPSAAATSSSTRTCSSPSRSSSPDSRRRARSQALIAELDRLRNEPITERELERTKNQFARDYILGRATVQHKAGVLAHAAVLHDDLDHRRRRVRHLPEHDAGRRAARGEDLLHAGDADGAHDPAAIGGADGGGEPMRRAAACAVGVVPRRWPARRGGARRGRRSGRRGRSPRSR